MAKIIWDMSILHVQEPGRVAVPIEVRSGVEDGFADAAQADAAIAVRRANYQDLNNNTPGLVIRYAAQAFG